MRQWMAIWEERLKAALAGRYEMKRELGRGGMAVVYEAWDVSESRPVALKVLQPELAATVGGERFVRETQIAARLSHPTSAVAFCGVIYSVWAYFAGRAVPGWASVVAITTYLFGILFILIGLIGDYVGRMLKEVRGRPRYLVSEVVGPAAEGGELHDAREYTDAS
jgi:serine/threonine protein kinase